MTSADVGPHELRLVKPTLLERIRGLGPFCEACYVMPRWHPVRVWSEARPWRDRTRRGPNSVGIREDLPVKPPHPPINPSNRGG